MELMKRVSELLAVDVDRVLEGTERPGMTIERLVRDMDDSIVDLRRELVGAVLYERQLKDRLHIADQIVAELDHRARLARDRDERESAWPILQRRAEALKLHESATAALEAARSRSRQLKRGLLRMDRQISTARRRQAARSRRGRSGTTTPTKQRDASATRSYESRGTSRFATSQAGSSR